MKDFKKKVVSGFAWEASTRLIAQVISWASTLWVARILSPDDYGIVAISGIFTGFFNLVSGLGLGSALVQRRLVKDIHLANVFWLGLASGVLAYAILVLLSFPLAAIYEEPELVTLIQVAGLIVVLSSIGIVPRALAMRKLLLKQGAIISLVSGLSLTIMTLTMALAGFGYWSLIVSTLVAELIVVAGFWGLTAYRLQRPARILTVVPYARYGLKLSAGGILGFLNGYWPMIVVSAFFGKTSAGHLQIAKLIAGVPMEKIGQIFLSIAFPAFARIQRDHDRRRSVFQRLLVLLYAVTLPMFLGLAVVAEDLVPLLIGEQWRPAVVAIQLICIANCFAIGSYLSRSVVDAFGKPEINIELELLMVVCIPPLLLVGSLGGANGTILAWTMSFPIGFIFVVTKLHNLLGVKLSATSRRLLPVMGCGICMVLVVFGIHNLLSATLMSTLPKVALQVLGGAATYVVCLFFADRKLVDDVVGLIRSR